MKNVNLMSKLFIALSLIFINLSNAFAGITNDEPTQVPEPSMLSLFAVAGVVMFILKKRNK